MSYVFELFIQGTNASQLEKEIGMEFPPNERFFGLANVCV